MPNKRTPGQYSCPENGELADRFSDYLASQEQFQNLDSSDITEEGSMAIERITCHPIDITAFYRERHSLDGLNLKISPKSKNALEEMLKKQLAESSRKGNQADYLTEDKERKELTGRPTDFDIDGVRLPKETSDEPLDNESLEEGI